MLRGATLAAVALAGLAGCHSTSFNAMRTVFPADRPVQVACAEYPNDPAEFQQKLRAAHAQGWRPVMAGQHSRWFIIFGTYNPYVCFERPTPGAPRTPSPAAARPEAEPAPPALAPGQEPSWDSPRP